jgi:hypothetical protein
MVYTKFMHQAVKVVTSENLCVSYLLLETTLPGSVRIHGKWVLETWTLRHPMTILAVYWNVIRHCGGPFWLVFWAEFEYIVYWVMWSGYQIYYHFNQFFDLGLRVYLLSHDVVLWDTVISFLRWVWLMYVFRKVSINEIVLRRCYHSAHYVLHWKTTYIKFTRSKITFLTVAINRI